MPGTDGQTVKTVYKPRETSATLVLLKMWADSTDCNTGGKMNNCTKGEWEVKTEKGGGTAIVSGGQTIASLYWFESEGMIANAHLIAAAPDCYEALKESKAQLKLWIKDHGDDIATLEAINLIDKALAKAEGK